MNRRRILPNPNGNLGILWYLFPTEKEDRTESISFVKDLPQKKKVANKKKIYSRGRSTMNFDELKDKFVPYGFTISRAIFCAPSNLLFMAFFAPSRYESKLWDLKLYLQRETLDSEHIKVELTDFATVYRENTSRWFEAFLNSLGEQKQAKLEKKYIYYTRSAVDWELLRVQPMRYVWNETDQLTLYGLVLTAVIGINSLLKTKAEGPNQKPGPPTWKQRFQALDTVDAILKVSRACMVRHNGWKSKWSWYRSILSTLPSRIKFPILLVNSANFSYLLGGYKNPRKQKKT